MCRHLTLLLFFCVLVKCCYSSQVDYLQNPIVKRFINNCAHSNNKLLCFVNKAAKVLERSMDWNITFFDGMTFVRNKKEVADARSTQSGFGRFVQALKNFLNLHTLSVDLTSVEESQEEEKSTQRKGGGGGLGFGGGGGGGGFGGYSKKGLQKEAKYVQYAFMVLLGIFGLTGPVIMKTLALLAGKALIASKMALIIVGSVALKKIFEKDHEKSSVKVHTLSADYDSHDRIYMVHKNPSQPLKPLYYWRYDPYAKKST